ncbi:MAG TPA: protein kinase [Polyangiales bacterium]
MPRAGHVVGGKYRLIHPLGIGGMGMVWRAEHEALKQHVALKLLHVSGPQAQRTFRRFQREAQIAASIRHRNIVYISDFGTNRNEPYIVMELLNGVPLSERMVVGEPLSVGVFLHLMEEALQGLAAVHAAGVVHRDMKPENIFLVRELDGTMFPKLLDFGVSRSTERDQGHTITREGIVMGTPEYISPEQARGKLGDVRSDLYSLGVVMYEALAGRLPFQADNPGDLIVALLNQAPIPLCTLRPELGEPLSKLVGRAMNRDPDQRFQTSEEMRSALSEYLAANDSALSLSLPKRFHAPPPAHEEEPSNLDPEYDVADTQQVEFAGPTIAVAADVIPGMHRSRMRWAMMAAAVATALALGFTLNARTSGTRLQLTPPPAQASASRSARAISIELPDPSENAEGAVDGEPEHGPSTSAPGDPAVQQAAGSAPGHALHRGAHDAAHGARHAVSAEPAPGRGQRGRAKAKPVRRGGLLRTPDF